MATSLEILLAVAADTSFTETLVTPDPADLVLAVQPNPTRYALGFACNGTVIVTTLGSPPQPLQGVVITNSVTWFTVKDHAALAQAQWYLQPNSIGVFLTVFEVQFNR